MSPKLNATRVPPSLAENPLCNPECRVCHYKHLDYPAQLLRKQQWANSQLGCWGDVLRDIRPAPLVERLGYRSKSWMMASFPRVQEGSSDQEGQGAQDEWVSFGMFRSIKVEGRWAKEFVSWNTCPLHMQAIQLIIERLRAELSKESTSSIAQALVGIWIGSPHLVIVSREPGLKAVIERLDWGRILAAPFDRVWFHLNSQVGRHVFGHRPIELIVGAGDDSVHPIRAFRQIAQTLLQEARRMALDALLLARPSLVLDLYCGTGDLSLLLPPDMGWIGIELAKEAVRYANTLRNPESVVHAAFAGAVEQRLCDPNVLNKIGKVYALYLNPPRSGLTEEARERVLALLRGNPPTAIVYLSCSASSLARDLEVFEMSGFCVQFLQPYDFFPQTEHFETLAILAPQ